MEKDRSLLFLDGQIYVRVDGSLDTQYTGSRHTRKGHHPRHLASVATTRINAHHLYVHGELEHVRKVLPENGHKISLMKKGHPAEATRQIAYLPFVKGETDRIVTILRKQYNIKTVFTPLQKFGQMMRSPKDRLPYQYPVTECKDKWKNLRYGLLRSLRPTRDGSAKKKYYLHEDMAYLIPYIGTGALRCRRKMLIEELKQLTNEDHVDALMTEYENHQFEMPNDLDRYDIVKVEEPLKKKAKTQYDIRNIHSDQETSRTKCTDDNISRKMFLLSLLPEIANFSESQMKTFRRRIFGLVDEIIAMELNLNVVKSEPL